MYAVRTSPLPPYLPREGRDGGLAVYGTYTVASPHLLLAGGALALALSSFVVSVRLSLSRAART